MTDLSAQAGSYSAANEPVMEYRPRSVERKALSDELARLSAETLEIPLVIGGKRIQTQERTEVVVPHATRMKLACVSQGQAPHAHMAIAAATAAHREWSQWQQADRAAIFLKAADLLAGPWRQRLNAATMLGQSKTAHQAEIDSACELIDFLRFNVQFAAAVAEQQPVSGHGVRNVIDYRPLEGFVYAVTPFNFTAIGGNLPTAPALLGNTVIWKPAATAVLSNYLFMQLLEEAGLPPGVINFVPGDATGISAVAIADQNFAGLHFTGSTAVFDRLWQQVAGNLPNYRGYPRLVGETGGKDFVVAHASADPEALATALVRGAFEYQGQKCSAASRAYISRTVWPEVKQRVMEMIASIKVGDVADFDTFMGAVIDRAAFDRIRGYLDPLSSDGAANLLTRPPADAKDGFFIAPSLVEVTDPRHRLMREEIFGPVLTVVVFDDANWIETLELIDSTSPYGLTGAVFARDRSAIAVAREVLRYSAGNFYVNDKPTGAVVGQQPFGGARRSGTNDKAGSHLNLIRWTSPRTIKETYTPARDYRYPSMADVH